MSNSGGGFSPRVNSDDSTLSSTNLDRLMESVTPRVPSQVKTRGTRNREAADDDVLPFFALGDLWESYSEWSAYGAGVPLNINGSDSVTQYYVPFLSGMQIYVDKNRPRRPSEDSDAECLKVTSNEFETKKRAKQVVDETTSQQNSINLISQRTNRVALSEKPPASSCTNETEASNSRGQLIFEYMEQEQPYHRKPLYDKISSLASQFPGISTYRSCDLLPSKIGYSSGQNLFIVISFVRSHLIIGTWPGKDQPQFHALNCKKGYSIDAASKISIPVFGLASYKLRGSILMPNGASEWKHVNSLMQNVDKFLKGLHVSHHDFQFFASHNSQWRC
ncbi:hypothetical protein ACFE04_019364 [Oxalis oulophora]